MMLSDEQQQAFNYGLEGHNLLITGQCGTGKTFAMKAIINEMKRLQQRIAVTSTTGVASHQLGLGASTIHLWSGIGDGRLSTEELTKCFIHDEQFTNANSRIKETSTLFIDEIGMLSQMMFEKIELVCRLAKGNNHLFGKIQVIASGDFKQLPPVPNHRYEDDGQYCFIGNSFQQMFPHHFNFKEVIRQNEDILIKAINELCNGSPSDETEHFLKQLNGPLESDDVKYIYGTNFDVQYVNHEKLDAIPGNATYFQTLDEGQTSLLLNCPAPKALVLKVGAPVILLRNLSQKLYNGCFGKVHDVSNPDCISVNFHGNIVVIHRERFECYDPRLRKVLAVRKQFPLILAYAVTVHRAQGQTIDNVEVDCSSFFTAGQMGVAIGRAVSTKGLRITNYNATAARLKHDTSVFEFYNLESVKPVPDLTCCRFKHFEPLSFEDENKTAEETGQYAAPSTSSATESLAAIDCPFEISLFLTEECSSEITTTEQDRILHLAKLHYGKLDELFHKHPTKSADFTKLYKDVNVFLCSDMHMIICKEVFNVSTVTEIENRISTKLFRWVLKNEIAKRAKEVEEMQAETLRDINVVVGESVVAAGKIRYLAGACIVNIQKNLKTTVLNSLAQRGQKSKLARTIAYKKRKLLATLRISEEDAMQKSNFPESLAEVQFRQENKKQMFHVCDEVFNFFMSLNKKVQVHLLKESFHFHGQFLHDKCRTQLVNDTALTQQWLSLFSGEEPKNEIDENAVEIFSTLLIELYQNIANYFFKVALSNAIKEFKASIPRTKKQALRVKIQALGERKSSGRKRKIDQAESVTLFVCPVCKLEISEDPKDSDEQSIGCDSCDKWFHYKCASLTGNELFLKREHSEWKCPGCSSKGC